MQTTTTVRDYKRHIKSALSCAASIKATMEAYGYLNFRDSRQLFEKLPCEAQIVLKELQPWNLPCESGDIDECAPEELIELRDQLEGQILEEVLDVEFNWGWHPAREMPDGSSEPPEKYRILLCTGGPAVRLTGELRDGGLADTILEAQDWFIPWESLEPVSYPEIDKETQEALVDYAQLIIQSYLDR